MAVATENFQMENMENLVWPVDLPIDVVSKEGESGKLKEINYEDADAKRKVMTIDDAVQQYSLNFGLQSDQFLGFNRKAFPWGSSMDTKEESAEQSSSLDVEVEVKSAFQKDLQEPPPASETPAEPRKRYRFQSAVVDSENREEDSDGEEVWLCKKCRLPLGDIRYTDEDEDRCKANGLHGECMAQGMLAKMGAEDAEKIEKDRKEKAERHEAYGIGWKTSHIPRNDSTARKLTLQEVPQGMVCLVFDEETRTVGVASTFEPAASVNLEYLSVALQVRRKEGHEPVFSLDPVNPEAEQCERHKMQEKVFVPQWLA